MQIGNNTLIQCWAIRQFDVFQKPVQNQNLFSSDKFWTDHVI